MAFSKKELTIHTVLSVLLLVAGAVTIFMTRGDHNPDGFWYGYLLSAYGAGIMAVVVGVIWMAMSLSQAQLGMFSLDRKMDTEPLLAVLLVVGLVVAVMIYKIVPGLPVSDAMELQRQMEPESIRKILAMESNFKGFVTGGLILFGIWLAAVPCVRCFKQD